MMPSNAPSSTAARQATIGGLGARDLMRLLDVFGSCKKRPLTISDLRERGTRGATGGDLRAAAHRLPGRARLRREAWQHGPGLLPLCARGTQGHSGLWQSRKERVV